MGEQYNWDGLEDDQKRNLLHSVPLRVLSTLSEVDYQCIPVEVRSVSDKLEFFQGIVNSLRIHDFGDASQDLFQALYKQGVLFDHTRAALTDGDVNKYADRRTWKEIADEPPTGKVKGKSPDALSMDFADQWLIPDKPEWLKEKERVENKKKRVLREQKV